MHAERESLAALLSRETLPRQRLVAIARSLVGALAEAHANGRVHHGLHPDCVIIDASDNVTLEGFGSPAKLTLTAPERASAPPRLFAYAAPELVRGETADARADLFSVGCILYEMATGSCAFERPTAMATLLAVVTDVPPPISATRRDLPDGFDRIVDEALQKAPDRRTPTAAALGAELDRLADLKSPRPPVDPGGLPATFVGRRALVDRMVDLVASRGGNMTFLTGEAGVGKTRLAQVFTEQARARTGAFVLAGRCVEQDGPGEAYLPFFEALASATEPDLQAEVTRVLRARAPTWCLGLPDLVGDVVGQLRAETMGASKARMQQELVEALETLAAERPLLVVLDDLHWMDRASLDLLDHLAARLPEGVLIIGAYRPWDAEARGNRLRQIVVDAVGRGDAAVIPLERLTSEQVGDYVRARLGDGAQIEELTRMLHARSEGHPLFLTTLLDLLLGRGAIVKEAAGTHRIAGHLTDLTHDMPQDARSMIEGAIARIGEDDRRLLRYASVLGVEFSARVGAALSGVDEDAFASAMVRVMRAHPIVEATGDKTLPSGVATRGFRFTHVLFQQALYARVVESRRAELHGKAGVALETSLGPSAATHALTLASHYERGGDMMRAAQWREQAGENAARVLAHDEAIAHYEDALSLASTLPQGMREALSGTLLLRMAAQQLVLARAIDVSQTCARLLAVSRSAGFPVLECAGLTILGWAYALQRKAADAERYAHEALRIAESLQDRALMAKALGVAAYAALGHGDLAALDRTATRALSLAQGSGDPQAELVGVGMKALLHMYRSDYAAAAREGATAYHLAFEARDQVLAGALVLQRAIVAGNLGRFSEAQSFLERAIAGFERNRNPYQNAFLYNTLAWVLRETGRHEEATELDARGLECARAVHNGEALVSTLLNLAEGAALAGRTDEKALSEVQALLVREAWMRWRFAIRYERVVAEAHLRRGELGKAAERARALVRLAAAHDASKYAALGHVVLAEVAALQGDSAEAAAEVAAARAPLGDRPVPLIEWRVHRADARARKLTGDRAATDQAYAAALRALEGLTMGIDDEALRAAMLASRDAVGLAEEAHGRW